MSYQYVAEYIDFNTETLSKRGKITSVVFLNLYWAHLLNEMQTEFYERAVLGLSYIWGI